MKKSKLWLSFLTTTSLSTIALTAIACNYKNTNQPQVSNETPKIREVGAKATRTYFLIKQSNISSPEETKIKMVNLRVNGAEAIAVSGLVKSVNDSSGNILVVFNMALAQTQYNASTITFDLKLTNKPAGTEYLVSGFDITLTNRVSAVTYNIDNAKGIKLAKYPDSVGEDEDLKIEFTLEPGYKWDEASAWDITANGTSIKKDILSYEETPGDLVSLKEDGNTCYIYVPQTLIPSNSEVVVTFNSDGKVFNVSQAGIDKNITYDALSTIQHDTNTTTINFKANDYYNIQYWDVTMNDGTGKSVSIKDKGASLIENNTKLLLDQSKIYGDISISATAAPKKWAVTMPSTSHLLSYKAECTYGEDTTVTIASRDSTKYKPKKTLTFTCVDDVTKTSNSFNITSLNDNGTYIIPKDKVTGPITITPEDEGQIYTVTSTGIGTNVVWTGASTAQYSDTSSYNATLKPSSAYYQIKDADWDIKRDGTSIKSQATWNKTTGSFSLPGTAITGNLAISATASNNSWNTTLTGSTHMTTSTLMQATYNTTYSQTIEVSDAQYSYAIASATCIDAISGETINIKDNVTLTTTSDPKKLTLAIAASKVTGPISISCNETPKQYNVALTKDSHISAFSGTIGSKAATHDADYIGTFTCDDYYELDTVTIVSGTKTLVLDEDYSISNNTLTIKGASLIGDITITATSKLIEYDVDVSGTSTGLTFTAPTQKPQHGIAYSISYALTDGYSLDTSSVKCVVTGGKELTIGSGLTLIATVKEQTISVTDPTDIVGKLTFTGQGKQISVSSTATGIASVQGDAKYLKATTLSFNMSNGYAWASGSDFTNSNIVIKSNGITIDPTNLTIGTDDEKTVTIKEGYVTGPITITGSATHFTASAQVKSGSSSIITNLSAPKYTTVNSDYVVTFTTSSGYISPSATVKVNGEVLLASDYTISTTGITIPTSKVTGPVEITDITALKELKWASTFEDTVKAGSTSTYAYSATAAAGGTPTVSIKTAVTGVSLDSNNKLVVASDVTVGSTVTLQAKLDGGVTIERDVTIAEATKELTFTETYSGTNTSSHRLDYDTDNSITLKPQLEGVEVTENLTWTVSGTGVAVSTTGVITATDYGKQYGGSATVTCEYNSPSTNKKITGTYDVEIATWGKIGLQTSNQTVTANKNTSGLIIVPSRYWVNSEERKVLTLSAFGGTTRINITQVVIPETITTIADSTFSFSGMSYTSQLTSLIFTGNSQLQTIGGWAFTAAKITTNLVLPSTLTSIGKYAFSNSTFSYIEFTNKTNWYINDGVPTAIAESELSDPSINATNLKTKDTWKTSGLIRTE